jgi:hypothetical protein
MKNKMNVKAYKKLTRIVRVIIQALFWICAALGGLTILSNIVFIFIPQHFFELNDNIARHVTITTGGFLKYSYELAPNIVMNLKPLINVISVLVIISSVLMLPILYQLNNILKNVENDLPFAPGNAHSLSIIGYMIAIGTFVLPLAEALVGTMIMNIIKVPNITVNYSINFYMLIMSFFIFILAGIFKYGNYLQQEYDTTL